jgi:shikimate dehydrogenase
LADYDYELYEVNPNELKINADVIKELNGFNVTIPYKLEIIPYLDRLDESAARYGSVNCVCYNDLEYTGYNTDGYGFLKAVNELGASLNSKVLLLGCGGTGRMMAIESVYAGAELTLAIRRDSEEEKAAAKLSRELGSKIRITYADTLNIVNSYDLCLNATPSGMYPNVDEIPIVSAILSKVKYLFDAIYNPSPTKLMIEAQKQGAKALGGLTMLVHQAVMSQMLWNDIQISDNIVRTIINESKQRV